MSLEFALERYEKGYTDLDTIDGLVEGIRRLQMDIGRLRRELEGVKQTTSIDDWEPTMRFFRD